MPTRAVTTPRWPPGPPPWPCASSPRPPARRPARPGACGWQVGGFDVPCWPAGPGGGARGRRQAAGGRRRPHVVLFPSPAPWRSTLQAAPALGRARSRLSFRARARGAQRRWVLRPRASPCARSSSAPGRGTGTRSRCHADAAGRDGDEVEPVPARRGRSSPARTWAARRSSSTRSWWRRPRACALALACASCAGACARWRSRCSRASSVARPPSPGGPAPPRPRLLVGSRWRAAAVRDTRRRPAADAARDLAAGAAVWAGLRRFSTRGCAHRRALGAPPDRGLRRRPRRRGVLPRPQPARPRHPRRRTLDLADVPWDYQALAALRVAPAHRVADVGRRDRRPRRRRR